MILRLLKVHKLKELSFITFEMPFGGLRASVTSSATKVDVKERSDSPSVRRKESTPPKKRDPSPRRRESTLSKKRESTPSKKRESTPAKNVHSECKKTIEDLEERLEEADRKYDELYDQMGEWEAILKDPLEFSKNYEDEFKLTIYEVLEDQFIKHLQNTGKWPTIRPSPTLTRSSGVSASVKPYESRYARVPSSMIMRSTPNS